MEDYTDFVRYLASKKSVDDRALNQQVWEQLVVNLKDIDQPIRILEIGGGIGTMIERLLERDVLKNALFTLLDEQAENIAEARRRLPAWAEKEGFHVSWDNQVLVLWKSGCEIQISFLTEDLFNFLSHRNPADKYDLLIAHAFLDLVDIPATLPILFDLLQSEGLFYFTINFDGETILEPKIPDDAQIIDRYHQTMDARMINGKLSGDSRAGRHLFTHLKNAGGEILSAGSSDWVVFANQNGYPADEAYFLRFIINTIHNALPADGEIAQDRIDTWTGTRKSQITARTLVYIAHQLDFLGRFP